MTDQRVRVRFAPSPTGGLHLGGVRTVLFNYLFAKKHGGDFILRIEDTDQTRFVPGAEEYIFQCLEWCGLVPDESPKHGGPFGPYRQSERKSLYKQYADKLVAAGQAYYAFDTPQELEAKRAAIPNFQYNQQSRQSMRNSLTLDEATVAQLLSEGQPHVVRIKMPEQETITFTDMIRGEVSFYTTQVDDKVLLKADGMPTYHLAVVVDDHLMQISHAFRGEEWLPSAPVHILLWKYLFGLEQMPQWAHLPLILKPDGNGKLSKRDGDRLGFPVFAMDWTDPKTNETTVGFRERGFLPQAFVNLLAMLGWNDGTDKEIFTIEELIAAFSMDRVHKGGAKFDFEKAKWFNQEWIKQTDAKTLLPEVKKVLGDSAADETFTTQVINLVKDRCVLLSDFAQQAGYFFTNPDRIDIDAIKPKWDEKKTLFFTELIRTYDKEQFWLAADLEKAFKEIAAVNELKPGELMLPFRIMLVGGKFGPGVFDIAALIGKDATIARINNVLNNLYLKPVDFDEIQKILTRIEKEIQKILRLFDQKNINKNELFSLGLLERTCYSAKSLEILINEYKKDPAHEFAIGVILRNQILDHLIVLYTYIEIENCKKRKENINETLDFVSDSILSDGLIQSSTFLSSLAKLKIFEEKKILRTLDNFKKRNKYYFEFLEKNRNKLEIKPNQLFKRIAETNEEIALIYDSYIYYSQYNHYGLLYLEASRRDINEKNKNIRFVSERLLLHTILALLILSEANNEHKEYLKLAAYNLQAYAQENILS